MQQTYLSSLAESIKVSRQKINSASSSLFAFHSYLFHVHLHCSGYFPCEHSFIIPDFPSILQVGFFWFASVLCFKSSLHTRSRSIIFLFLFLLLNQISFLRATCQNCSCSNFPLLSIIATEIQQSSHIQGKTASCGVILP